jgi:NAD-dependent SIR2 family protein deacetylase
MTIVPKSITEMPELFSSGANRQFMIQIGRQDRVFILTGSGVSAESGIPTFRGAGGLWRNYRIDEVASPDAWARDPRLVWDFYSMRRNVAGRRAQSRASCTRGIGGEAR